LNHRPRVQATRQGFNSAPSRVRTGRSHSAATPPPPSLGERAHRVPNPPLASTAMEDPLAASWQGSPPPITARLSGSRCERMAQVWSISWHGLRTDRTGESGRPRHNFQPAAHPLRLGRRGTPSRGRLSRPRWVSRRMIARWSKVPVEVLRACFEPAAAAAPAAAAPPTTTADRLSYGTRWPRSLPHKGSRPSSARRPEDPRSAARVFQVEVT
jgi:hypothetical protein